MTTLSDVDIQKRVGHLMMPFETLDDFLRIAGLNRNEIGALTDAELSRYSALGRIHREPMETHFHKVFSCGPFSKNQTLE